MTAYQAVTARACQIRPGTTPVRKRSALRDEPSPSTCRSWSRSDARRRRAAYRRVPSLMVSVRPSLMIVSHRRRWRQMLCRDLADRILEGRGLARLPVHVNAHGLAGRRDLAGLGVTHLVQETDRFFSQLQKPASDLD